MWPDFHRIYLRSVYQQRLGINLRINNVFNELASKEAIRKFVDGVGDPNPLWRDPGYARRSRYGALVAPPSWVASVFPTWVLQGLPGVHAFQTSTDWRLHQPVFEEDRIKPQSTFTKFRFLEGGFAGRSILETQQARYFNQRDELVAQAEVSGLRAERDAVRERAKYGDLALPHPWSDEELLAIQEQVLGEKARGAEARYWEDVALGEELPAIVKGPLGLTDIIAYCIGAAPVRILANGVALREYQKHPAWAFRDPGSKSLEPMYSVHYNTYAAQGAGLPLPYDIGTKRHCWLMQMLTNWMGDEGWLKRCYARYTGFVFLSDAIWIRGEVTKKYVDEHGEHCVDVATCARNQRDKDVMPGESTVILPSRRSGTGPLDTRLRSNSFRPKTQSR
jgi:acyl dehydratase